MDITSKLWNFCHILRHDGMDYADYVEQLTYLLFLKMVDEGAIAIPENCHWRDMLVLSGNELTAYYDNALNTLKEEPRILGQIFQEPVSKIKNAINLSMPPSSPFTKSMLLMLLIKPTFLSFS